MKSFSLFLVAFAIVQTFAGGEVSNVTARQRYPWNGMVDIDCTVTGTAGTTYSLTVNARDKVGGTNLTVKTVSIEGESASGNPVSVTSGVYRLVWNADTDLPNGFRGEKVSISVTVTDSAKKFMIVDLSTGAITYQSAAPEGGWDVDEYKGTKMAFVRIEPGTFTQYSIEGLPGREVTITKPYYMGMLPVTHKQMRTLCGESYARQTFGDSYDRYTPISLSMYDSGIGQPIPMEWSCNGMIPYRGGSYCYYAGYANFQTRAFSEIWPKIGHSVDSNSPIGILRSRTGIQQIDLPTEAQILFAKNVLCDSDQYTMCLDIWVKWLGTSKVNDPQGEIAGENWKIGSTYSPSEPIWESTCANATKRESIAAIGICSTRFCIYETE